MSGGMMGTNEGGVWVPISSPQFEGGDEKRRVL